MPLLYYSSDFPYYDSVDLGRFTPIVSMEYNFVGLFSTSPFAYFLYHSLQFIFFAVLLVFLLRKVTSSFPLIYLTSAFLFLLPAFTISWFRLQLPERNAIFLFAALLLCFYAYLKEERVRYIVFGLLIANLALYYKETAFLVIGGFGFSYLVLSWRSSSLKTKIFACLLWFSSLLYLTLYYFLIYLHGTPFVLRAKIYNQALVFLKNFLNYATFSDPILVLLLLPLTFWRAYRVFWRRDPSHPLYDSMLVGASLYVIAYFALGIYGVYYLLPAYIFAIPPLWYYLLPLFRVSRTWNILAFLALFFMVVNAIPAGIHYLTYNKYLPLNFNKTLNFLIQDIEARHPRNRPSIFLDGVNRGTGAGTYFIFAEFLYSKGLSWDRFDMQSSIEADDPTPLVSKIQPPLTVFGRGPLSPPQKGDYLVITPQSTGDTSKAHRESLVKDYELIFQTKSTFAFPRLTLKTLVKYFLARILPDRQKQQGVLLNENLLEQPDYYVFIRR